MNRLLVYRNESSLSAGMKLLLNNKRLLLWAYLASLIVGLRVALPMHARLSPILDHSLAAQGLAGRFDVSYYALLTMNMAHHGTSIYAQAFLAVLGYCVFVNVLAAGTYYVFGTGELPWLATVLRSGVEYFWRFFRLLLFGILIGGPVIAILVALRAVVLKHADNVYVERPYFYVSVLTFVVIALMALVFRLWFDLAEASVIQLGIEGDSRVRRSLWPSLRLMRARFAPLYFSYLLIGILGWIGFILFVFLWIIAVPPRAVPLAWILGQLGVTSLLAARIWQRGLATAAVAFADPLPIVHTPIFTPPTNTTLEQPATLTSPTEKAEPVDAASHSEEMSEPITIVEEPHSPTEASATKFGSEGPKA